MDHFDFLSRGLKSIGYTGKFIPKPDSPCIYLQGNNGPDGCAIFVKVITNLINGRRGQVSFLLELDYC